MTAATTSAADGRRLAWAVLAFGLLLAVVLSVQAARRGLPPAAGTARIAAATGPVRLAPAPVIAPIESAAPAVGTTGSIVLPPLPAIAAAAPPADLGVVAARPFRLGRVDAGDRARALECLTAAVYYEAAAELDAGQQAVAQVVLNRVRHPAFPATVCGVVYQGSERAGCQFSFACDGAMLRRPPLAAGWARAARTAAAALGGRVYAPVGLATHYHTFAVTPAWNRALVMTDAVGAHFFHRWKGWWGTPAAFRQLYAGGEPLPGPHAPLALPEGAPAMLPLLAPVAPLPPRPVVFGATAQPADRDGGAARGAAPAEDRLPAAPTVLPRWAESGRPLR